MTKREDARIAPAYISYKTLMRFLDSLRETGVVPQVVDRRMLSNYSGSVQNTAISSMRWLGLLDQDNKPTPLFAEFVMASDEKRKALLGPMLKRSYSFLFDDQEFDIERASSQQTIDLFKKQGLNATTLYRSIVFFRTAAEEAGLKISPHIKPPAVSRGAGNGRAKKQEALAQPPSEPKRNEASDPSDVHRFEVPIPGKPSVSVLVPKSLDAADWEMVSEMLKIYVGRWKGFANSTSKDKGPT